MRSDRLRIAPAARRTAALAVACAAVGGGVALAATASQSEPREAASRPSVTADVSDAHPVNCGAALKPATRPDAVLNRLFHVTTSAGERYLLGWTLFPYTGAGEYQVDGGKNLLAVQPASGGAPLGYGSGSVTTEPGDRSGTIDAVLELRSGGRITVTGAWRCSTSS